MPQSFAMIPWRHHTEIITKCQGVDEALFYINKTIENNWSRAVLVHQMETGLYQSLGKSVNNFDLTIPETERLDVSEILKESYTFDFIPAEQKLKVEEFSPSFIGQLGFYVTASDHLLKQKDDNPTIGLLICKSKKKTVVEWSLANMVSPIGFAEAD